jgi:hypothetical protein
MNKRKTEIETKKKKKKGRARVSRHAVWYTSKGHYRLEAGTPIFTQHAPQLILGTAPL